MKRFTKILFVISCIAVFLNVELYAADWQFSGISETKAGYTWGYDFSTGPENHFGLEQYANLRLKASIGDYGALVASLNLFTYSGAWAQNALAMNPEKEEFYTGTIDIDRLYYQIRGDQLATDIGILRISFGYGQIFRPTDFLINPNPLNPDARPRGILGVGFSWYPSDTMKAYVFGTGPQDVSETWGRTALAGIASDVHGPFWSIQSLYAFQAGKPAFMLGPLQLHESTSDPVHRFGTSIKYDGPIACILEALYTFDTEWNRTGKYYNQEWRWYQGLELAAGVDFSLFDGRFISTGQYRYNGGSALKNGDRVDALYSGTWATIAPDKGRPFKLNIPIRELNHQHYMAFAAIWKIDDYTIMNMHSLVALEDASFLTTLGFEYTLFQGCGFHVSGQMPLDMNTFDSNAWYGELGPAHLGYVFQTQMKLVIRF
ncbi:MAG: hypothetical protein LDL24_10280 [Treponema sp.]|nr:hypothetical protein [Treponema sp.]